MPSSRTWCDGFTRQQPLHIGLTGGIASGKSTLAACCGQAGWQVLDVDHLVAALYRPGSPCWRPLLRRFGRSILMRGGQGVAAPVLRRRLFADYRARRFVEQRLFPLLKNQVQVWLQRHAGQNCLVQVPLLYEAGWEGLFDQVWTVDCPAYCARRRLSLRNRHWTARERNQVLRIQISRQERLRRAGGQVLVNGGGCVPRMGRI